MYESVQFLQKRFCPERKWAPNRLLLMLCLVIYLLPVWGAVHSWRDTSSASVNEALSGNRAFAGGRREGSERRSFWGRGALRPVTVSSEERRRDADLEEKPPGGGDRDRRDVATSLGTSGAPVDG